MEYGFGRLLAAGSMALALSFGATAAMAATCSNDGVVLTSVDSNPFGPESATACFGAESGNLNPAQVQAALASDLWGFGNYTWTYLGKAEETASDPGVSADVGQVTGSWSADFGANEASVFAVLLKAGSSYSVFFFDIAPTIGSLFEGTFNTQLAGLVGPQGQGQDLSHLEVAGVYTGGPGPDPEITPIPLPAAGWLLIGGLGALAAMRRRRKAA